MDNNETIFVGTHEYQEFFIVKKDGSIIMGKNRLHLDNIFSFLVGTFPEQGLIKIILEYYFFIPHIMMELLRLTFPLYNKTYYFDDEISYYEREKLITNVEWVNGTLKFKSSGIRYPVYVETKKQLPPDDNITVITEDNVRLFYYNHNTRTYMSVYWHIIIDGDYDYQYIVDDGIDFTILRVLQRAGIIKSFPNNEKFSNIENWYIQNHSDVCE